MIPLHVFNHTVKRGRGWVPREFAKNPSMLYSGYEPYSSWEYYDDALRHGLIVEKPFKNHDQFKTVSLTKKGIEYLWKEFPTTHKYETMITASD